MGTKTNLRALRKSLPVILSVIILLSIMLIPVSITYADTDFEPRRIRIDNNNQFVVGHENDPQRIWINGVNTPWDSWDDFGGNFRPEFWDNHFRVLRENGVNSSRVWISGRNNHDAIQITTNGTITGTTSLFWEHLDEFFEIAKRHEIYIMATLISFDHFETYDGDWSWMGRPHPHESWRRMIQTEQSINSFVEHYTLPFVLRYRDNPFLWSIDIVNEPDWAYERAHIAASWEDFSHFIARNAAAIRENSDILVTVGMAFSKYNSVYLEGNVISDDALQAQYNNPNAVLDFWSPHYYDWVGEWFGVPFNRTPHGQLHQNGWGLCPSKPALIGETNERQGGGGTLIGFQRWGGTGTPFTPSGATFNLSQAYTYAFNHGWQGVMAWTSNGVDGYGTIDPVLGMDANVATATNHFYSLQPELVFPVIDNIFVTCPDCNLHEDDCTCLVACVECGFSDCICSFPTTFVLIFAEVSPCAECGVLKLWKVTQLNQTDNFGNTIATNERRVAKRSADGELLGAICSSAHSFSQASSDSVPANVLEVNRFTEESDEAGPMSAVLSASADRTGSIIERTISSSWLYHYFLEMTPPSDGNTYVFNLTSGSGFNWSTPPGGPILTIPSNAVINANYSFHINNTGAPAGSILTVRNYGTIVFSGIQSSLNPLAILDNRGQIVMSGEVFLIQDGANPAGSILNNSGSIIVESGSQLINHRTINNTGTITGGGQFTNTGNFNCDCTNISCLICDNSCNGCDDCDCPICDNSCDDCDCPVCDNSCDDCDCPVCDNSCDDCDCPVCDNSCDDCDCPICDNSCDDCDCPICDNSCADCDCPICDNSCADCDCPI
ncbi:MAG: hypothetical protein FWF76_03940, partial [Oscillospiraceae bacterium]|nr:hypothetical protein [Oscillospiraceae bacterium]